MWIMYGALAALLVLLAPALWRSVLVARRRATLFRLGTFLGDTHDDGEAMAWGRDLGVHASLRYQEASLSRNSALGAWFPFRRTTNPNACLLYTSPSPRDGLLSRMPSSA